MDALEKLEALWDLGELKPFQIARIAVGLRSSSDIVQAEALDLICNFALSDFAPGAQALLNHSSPITRRYAARALFHLIGLAALPALRTLLADTDLGVRLKVLTMFYAVEEQSEVILEIEKILLANSDDYHFGYIFLHTVEELLIKNDLRVRIILQSLLARESETTGLHQDIRRVMSSGEVGV